MVRSFEIVRARNSQESHQIQLILRPRAMVARQQLECQKVPNGGDRHPKPRQDFHRVSQRRDLRLDPR